MCDDKALFTNCFCGHVGSMHDQRVFKLSEIETFINSPAGYFPEGSYLVADAAYAIHTNLMVPFKDNGHLTRRQQNFNFFHSSSRMVVERSIGLLKGRFRSLLDKLPMTRVNLIPKYIIACCVLHNICLLSHDRLEVSTIAEGENFTAEPLYDGVDDTNLSREGGLAKRMELSNALPMRNA